MKTYSDIGTQTRPAQRSTLRKQQASKTQADHDCRNFDVSDSTYIDEERSKDNIYWTNLDDEDRQYTDFHDVLLDMYEFLYSGRLETINANHRADRHPEKQISIETFLERNMPEAEILQIGNAEDGGADLNDLAACVEDYIDQQNAWANAHPIFKDEEARKNDDGIPPFLIVTAAGHADETTPHFQLMRVWLAYDENGDIVPNREKALEQCGVALPNDHYNLDKDGNQKYKKNKDGSFKLDKKGNKIPKPLVDRFNNRNMTFTAESREMWYDICEEHGFNIIREPLQPRKHQDKGKYIHEREKAAEERSRALDEQQKQNERTARQLLETEIEQNEKDYILGSIILALDERKSQLDERENGLNQWAKVIDREKANFEAYVEQGNEILAKRESDLDKREAEIEDAKSDTYLYQLSRALEVTKKYKINECWTVYDEVMKQEKEYKARQKDAIRRKLDREMKQAMRNRDRNKGYDFDL